MSSGYPFSENDNYKSEDVLDSTVLVEDGVVWDQEEVHVALAYSSDQDDTLTENHNESYLTANEGSNDTHYFSVLETTNEAILNNLSDITVAANETEDAGEVAEEQPPTDSTCTIGGQPVIYRIEGSDDLYAFEVAYDEEGNSQRFRYRLRLNENQEYESVPESIELLPFEHDVETEPSQDNAPDESDEQESAELPSLPSQKLLLVKQEQETFLPDIPDVAETSTEDSNDELQVNEDEAGIMEEEETDQLTETKSGILEQNMVPIHNVKSETFAETFFDHTNQDMSAMHSEHLHGDVHGDEANSHANEETAKQPEKTNFEQILMTETHEAIEPQEMSAVNQVEKPFVPESDDDNTDDGVESSASEEEEEDSEEGMVNNIPFLQNLHENESDTDEYQIVDGVHITGDTESHDEIVLEQFFQREPSLQHQILKIQQQIPMLQSTMQDDKLKEMVNNNVNKVGKGFTYYVVKHPEKENVAAIAHPAVNKIKTNPRSLLKSSYLYFDQKKEKEKISEPKPEKKFVKNKDAMQAKVLHNFIAKTTILHAPIRQQRLPRKQTIKPVVRADEEIIVQEVVVSSNGFIETSEDGIAKSKVALQPFEIVQVTDSDDDYDPKKEHKRKRKQRKRKSKVTEIVISDTEEEDLSDDDIVQIDLSDDSEVENQPRRSTRKSSIAAEPKTNELDQNTITDANSGSKKRRGRPPKRRNSNNDETTSTTDGSSSSSKKQRRNTKDSIESNESTSTKSEEHSELEIQNIKTKWKCTICPKTFPSQGSLKTHMQYHNFHEPNSRNLRPTPNKEETGFKKPETVAVNKNKYECSQCGETFKNIILLTRHAKIHATGPKSLECSICRKPFSDRAQLINHKRTHVKEQMFNSTTLPRHSPKTINKAKLLKSSPKKSNFKCNYCTKIFTSLPLLNAHVRTHKRFTCKTCPASFISKLALEDHIRHNCVKPSKSPNRRLSLKTRKSFLAPPQRVSRRISLHRSVNKSNASNISTTSSSDQDKKTVNSRIASLPCDTCSMTFTSHKALFSHKVAKHGLNTPDKSILMSTKRKTLHKELGVHGNVPAGEKLGSAFSSLRTKLNL